MYATALAVTAAIAIFIQAYNQSQLSNQLDDARVVNIAGRQRMLSQKSAKLIHRIANEPHTFDKLNKELQETLAQWQHNHYALTKGSDSLGIPSNESEIIRRMYDVIEEPFLRLTRTMDQVVVEVQKSRIDSALIDRYLISIDDNEPFYLKGMEAIVLQFEEESREKVAYMKQVELLGLMLTLVTLLLEVLIIFYPTAKRIKRIISNLITSEKHAQEISIKLTELNTSLERSNKQVKDINFALNEATILIHTNENGIITYANDKYCHITKYKSDELIGKRIFENRLSEEESIVYEHMKDPINRNLVWQGEIYDHAKDGTYFWLDATLIPIISKEGELYQYIFICSNITKRKETQEQLERINEEKLEEQKNEQKNTSYAIITGQEKERKRMSQEIHDGVGQMLTGLKFAVESLEVEDNRQKEKVVGIRDQLHLTIKEVRRISSDLLPSVLNDFGLKAGIKDLVKHTSTGNKIDVQFYTDKEEEIEIDKHVETSLYRITQEAINNSLKYSEATEIRIKLTSDIEFLNLHIEDNGKGFDLEEAMEKSKSKSSGNGLANMKERTELINGKFVIHSQHEEGTQVYVEVPLEQDLDGED